MGSIGQSYPNSHSITYLMWSLSDSFASQVNTIAYTNCHLCISLNMQYVTGSSLYAESHNIWIPNNFPTQYVFLKIAAFLRFSYIIYETV